MNMNRLRATMALHGESITDLAKSLGMARQTLSSKMNGRREFTVGDVMKIVDHYKLSSWEVEAIFFPDSKPTKRIPVITMGEKVNARIAF